MPEILLEDFDYSLPKELIAQAPPPSRGESKLLHYDRKSKEVHHEQFSKLPDLPEGAVIVFNDTKVIKARVMAKRKTGAKIECFFIEKKIIIRG